MLLAYLLGGYTCCGLSQILCTANEDVLRHASAAITHSLISSASCHAAPATRPLFAHVDATRWKVPPLPRVHKKIQHIHCQLACVPAPSVPISLASRKVRAEAVMRSVVDLDIRRMAAASLQGLTWPELEQAMKGWIRDLRTVVRR